MYFHTNTLLANPSVKTVVNKVGNISTQFREFHMEVLAGENDLNVDMNEHGFRYKFDYSKVYWNSRLGTEHQRLPKLFNKDDIVADMFAGVGPFAIPASKNAKCAVHANDLNPNSYEYLKQNVKLNKVEKLVTCYNMDGREFIKHLVEKEIKFTQVIMNLPASAVEFIDVFKGLFTAEYTPLPVIHCYTFVRNDQEESSESLAKQSVRDVLGVNDITFTSVYNVRNIAPKKDMYCVSFKLPVNHKRKLELTDTQESSDSKKLKPQ
ncbi:tRNA (guanine(37)-N1)-methyltransferase [Acrasis kona]|uniref:tRNA (Guanine(37)-N1)-methyltransferase n=1 Tax=Acrasis kona TaxID=1008807 RepID=A0AAW2YY77_9EUKA